MKVELTIIISTVSVCASIYFGLSGFRRNQKNDDQKQASETTGIQIDLKNINNGVNEIKAEMRSIRDENKESRERLILVEASAKQAHKRIDSLEQLKGGE